MTGGADAVARTPELGCSPSVLEFLLHGQQGWDSKQLRKARVTRSVLNLVMVLVEYMIP